MELLLKSVPRNHGGLVKYDEFLESFVVRKVELATAKSIKK